MNNKYLTYAGVYISADVNTVQGLLGGEFCVVIHSPLVNGHNWSLTAPRIVGVGC